MSNHSVNWRGVILDILKILSGALAGYFATGCVSIRAL